MNRRTFLVVVGATACGGPPRKRAPPAEPELRGVERPRKEVEAFSWEDSQTQRSPVAIRDDLLVLSTGNELWTWDARTMKRMDGYVLPHQHFCFTQDGTLAVFALPKDPPYCVLHRIDGRGIRETLRGGVFGSHNYYPTHVLPGSSVDEVYVTKDDALYLMRAIEGRLEEVATIPIPDATSSNRGQLFSLGDGRLVVPGDNLHVLQAGKPSITYLTPGRVLLHMVPATAERIWYSHPRQGFRNADVLVLAKLATPMVEDKRIDLAPARIVHLASSGHAVAALLFEYRAGSSPTQPIRQWTVVVLDENGTTRWRAAVPKEFTPGLVTLNKIGFIAMSEHRVVLFGERPPIAWDATTGAPIG